VQADLCIGQEPPESTAAKKKKALFEKVFTTVTDGFNL
jgi:hypothetical protein